MASALTGKLKSGDAVSLTAMTVGVVLSQIVGRRP